MLKIKEQSRDSIVSYLKSIAVPAEMGANFMEIIKALNALEEIVELVVPEIAIDTAKE